MFKNLILLTLISFSPIPQNGGSRLLLKIMSTETRMMNSRTCMTAPYLTERAGSPINQIIPQFMILREKYAAMHTMNILYEYVSSSISILEVLQFHCKCWTHDIIVWIISPALRSEGLNHNNALSQAEDVYNSLAQEESCH